MANKSDVSKLALEVRNFARLHAYKVEKGIESRHTAALFVQEYGKGMSETAMRVLELDEPPKVLTDIISEEAKKIDPTFTPDLPKGRSGRRRRIG